jgi:hypothetical protein
MFQEIDHILIPSNYPSNSSINDSVSAGESKFSYYFQRFLFSKYFVNTPPDLALKNNYIIITFPELLKFQSQNYILFEPYSVIDFLSRGGNNLSCAITFSLIASKLLEQGYQNGTIFEDSLYFSEAHRSNLALVYEHLAILGNQWDVFTGTFPRLNSANHVLNISYYKGITFVIVNSTFDTSFNIYNKKILEYYARYNYLLKENYLSTEIILSKSKSFNLVFTIPPLFDDAVSKNSTKLKNYCL